MATRDSGGGQVQSTRLDRTWVLLHFILSWLCRWFHIELLHRADEFQ